MATSSVARLIFVAREAESTGIRGGETVRAQHAGTDAGGPRERPCSISMPCLLACASIDTRGGFAASSAV